MSRAGRRWVWHHFPPSNLSTTLSDPDHNLERIAKEHREAIPKATPGAMPALPHPASIATDTRIQNSRQLLRDAAQHLSTSSIARHLVSARQPETSPQPPRILPRQSDGNSGGIVPIPTVYQGLNAGPAPGAVVGIVLGSVAGFLLLIWLMWTLSNGSGVFRSDNYQEENVVVRRRSRSPRSRRSSRRTEMASRSPARRERVIRQERIVRDVHPPREPSRIRDTVIVDEPSRVERRVEGDDIVEVIEEHSSIGVGGGAPPRRQTRRSSGYRLVDPLLGGGDGFR